MPIVSLSSPPQINSVSDNITYELTLTSLALADTNIEILGQTPYGLAKFAVNNDPAFTPPTLAVGKIIYITGSSGNLYKGAHLIVEVLSSTQCVVNTIYKGYDNNMLYDVFDNFNFDLYEFPNLSIDAPTATIATIKGIPNSSNSLVFNVSEYLRSYLNNTKRSLMFGLGNLNLSLYGRSMVANSSITLYKISPLFAANNTTVETARTLVFFEGFKTFVSKVLKQDTSLDVKRAINDVSLFTMGSSYSGVILGSQTNEVQKGCFKDALNIVYVNFAGGLRNYVVYNDISITREFDEETRFKDSSLAEYLLQCKSHTEYQVLTENVRTTHQETIEQMIASPYTWLEINGALIPIIIEKQSIQLYRSYNESITLAFNFRLSETMQSQVL
jgi:hypothetical protein